MTITDFLTARYDEDEAVARAADIPEGDLSWTAHGPIALSSPDAFRVRTSRDMIPVALVQDIDDNTEPIPAEILDAEAVATHIALHDPARVLADIAAKRAIARAYTHAGDVAELERESDRMAEAHDFWAEEAALERVLHMLAQPYSDHADFDPAWRVR